jgi:hypothetical protein
MWNLLLHLVKLDKGALESSLQSMREHAFQIFCVAFPIHKLFKDQKEQFGNTLTPSTFNSSGVKFALKIKFCLNFIEFFPYVIISFPLKLIIKIILGSHYQNVAIMNGNVLAGIAGPTLAQNTFSRYYYYYYFQTFKDETYVYYIKTRCVPRSKHSPLWL